MAEIDGTNVVPSLEENAFPALGSAPRKPAENVPSVSTNGDNDTPEAPKGLSAAEKLMQQHLAAQEPVETGTKADPEAAAPLAEKKTGKQRAARPTPVTRGLDVSSLEAFPSLSKVAPVVAPMNWGAKMSALPVNGSNGTSGASTRPLGPTFLGSSGQQTIELTPAQKKPLTESRKAQIIKEIMKKTNTKIDQAQTSSGVSVFIVIGNEVDRQRARKEIYKELSLKASKTIQIPANVMPHIIGKGGSKVQELERETMTRIRVPQQSNFQTPAENYDDEVLIDVVIEGDEFGVTSAITRIWEIVHERPITIRIHDVPGEFYPFIQGPNRKNIEEFETKVDKVSVPNYFNSASIQPFSPPSGPIVIAGEKEAVLEVRAAIEKIVEELKSNPYDHNFVKIPTSKHKHFTENNGRVIHEILDETGCTVIFPFDRKDDRVTIYGPEDKIGNCYTKTNAISQVYQCISFDVCEEYPNAPDGPKLQARDITRYLKKRQQFSWLEQEFNAEITLPSTEELYNLNSPCIVGIAGGSKEAVENARSKIKGLYLQATSVKVARVSVEPLHHRHIIGRDGRGVSKLLGGRPVEILFPDDPQESEIVFVYEGDSTDTEEIRGTLDEVKELVLKFSKHQVAIISKTIDISKDHHKKIQGERNTTLNALNPSSVLVQFGIPKAHPGKPATPPTEDLENKITLRGPQSNVEATIKNINAFLAFERSDEFVTEPFEYPAKYSKNLIGAKGANINKLRDELGVDIRLKEGKGEIKGVRVTVEAAKRKLSAQVRELEDKTVVLLVVPQQFHSTIIGPKGESVQRLMARYDIRINFPRPPKSGSDYTYEVDASNKPQGPNEIIIKGGKKGVEEAQAEIMALLKYEETKNHIATIPIVTKAVEFMFRNSAKEIKQLRDESSVRIDLPQRPEDNSEEQMVIKIRGTQEEVKYAKAVLLKIVKDAEKMTIKKIHVDKKYHRSLIGQGGKALREIVVGAGGPDDRTALARMVRFPDQDSEADGITVQGNADVVDRIIKAIEKIIMEKKNQISITVDVAPEKHRRLIGREGSIRKELEAQFKVTIDIPNRNRLNQVTTSDIKITGAEEDVEKAKEYILELVKDPTGETIMVPRRLHHAISDITRELYKRYRVIVNHNNEPRPPKPEDQKSKDNGGDLPLITDEEESAQNYSWEVQENIQDAEDGDYPWVLSGSLENIAKAKLDVENAIKIAEKQTWIGFLDLPDPRRYRYVVGPKGAQIEKIRRQTACRITIPNKQANSPAPAEGPIVIHGSKDDLEKAREIILDLIHNGGKSGDLSDGDRHRHN